MKPFRTILARDLDSVSLKSEMETYGYVFIRDLMPKMDLEPLQAERAICCLLVFRIWIEACHGGIRDAVRWCGPLDHPALVRCNIDHIAEELL